MSLFTNINKDDLKDIVHTYDSSNITAIVNAVDYFHTMFVNLIENIIKYDNYLDFLMMCPLTRRLMINIGLFHYDTRKYIDDLYKKYKSNNSSFTRFPIYATYNYNFVVIALLDEYVIQHISTYRNHLQSVGNHHTLCMMFNEAHDITYLSLEACYASLEREYHSKRITVQLCQYDERNLRYVPSIDEEHISLIEDKLNTYFDNKAVDDDDIEITIDDPNKHVFKNDNILNCFEDMNI